MRQIVGFGDWFTERCNFGGKCGMNCLSASHHLLLASVPVGSATQLLYKSVVLMLNHCNDIEFSLLLNCSLEFLVIFGLQNVSELTKR